VVLYELLAGRVPFTGSPLDVLAAVVADDPPPPSRFRPGLDPRLEAICLKAMAKRPADRFASMAEFAAALDGFIHPRRASRRVAVLAAVSLVAVGGLVGLAAGTGLFGKRSTPHTSGTNGNVRQVTTGFVPLDPGEPPAEVRDLLAQMNDRGSPDARLDAIKRLANHRYVAVRQALEERLSTPPPRSDTVHWSERREAAVALKTLGDPAAADALARRVVDRNWMVEVRNEWPKRNPGGALVSDPDTGGKGAALDALAELAPDRVAPALRDALKSGEPLVRAWAAQELVKHPSPETTQGLCGLLRDKAELPRKRAAESLKALGDPAAIPALAARVADDVWMAERRTKLTGGAFADSFGDPEWGGKADALAALSSLDDSEAKRALKLAADSTDANVRQWAMTELARPPKK
jgi:HEAT repeat protein